VLGHVVGGSSGLVSLPLLLIGATGGLAAVAGLAALRPPLGPGPDALGSETFAHTIDDRVSRLALRLLGSAGSVALVVTAALGSPASAARAAGVGLSDLWAWVAFASLLLGPAWRLVSPLRPLAAAIMRLSGDRSGDTVRPLPPRLGWWPAAGGLLASAWVAFVLPGRPLVLLILLAALVLVAVGGIGVYGKAWLDHADPLEVYSAALGALAPIQRTGDGRLRLHSPRHRLAVLAAAPGTAAVCGALVGWYIADAIVETQAWHALTFPAGSLLAVRTAVLLACVAVVGLLAGLTTSRHGLAPALLPIVAGWALGYHLAPYAPPAALAGLVAGHLGAVVVAHDRAVARYGPRAASAQLAFRALVLALLVAGLALRFGGL
jgi:hypothetical protein